MNRLLIIGVGGYGCHLINSIKREIDDNLLNNTKFILADCQDRNNITFNCDCDDLFIDLRNVDLNKLFSPNILLNIDRIYIVAGLGGNTGTKWVTFFAQHLKKMNAKFVISVASLPFLFESEIRYYKAKYSSRYPGFHEPDIYIPDIDIVIDYNKLIGHYSDINLFNAFSYGEKAMITCIKELLDYNKVSGCKNIEREEPQGKITTENVECSTSDRSNKIDMIIAYDTANLLSFDRRDFCNYMTDIIHCLFKDREGLRIGMVAFRSDCDVNVSENDQDHYNRIPLTDNEKELIQFVKDSTENKSLIPNVNYRDELYKIVLRKIIDNSAWHRDSSKTILLITDLIPPEIGCTYGDFLITNEKDWEVPKEYPINIITIKGIPSYQQLYAIINISVPFKCSGRGRVSFC